MAYADEQDTVNLIGFPTVPSEKIAAWNEQFSGDLDLLLSSKGVVVPVTGPPQLLQTLRLAVTYGTAAMIDAQSQKGRDASSEQGAISIYQAQYDRIYNNLAALTAAQLENAGVIVITPGTAGVEIAGGLSLVGNVNVAPKPRWADRYPWRLTKS